VAPTRSPRTRRGRARTTSSRAGGVWEGAGAAGSLQEVGGGRQPARRRSSNEVQEVGEMLDDNPGGGLAAAIRAGGHGGACGRHGVRVVERQGRGAVVLVLVPVEDDGREVRWQGDGRRRGGGDGGLSAAAKGASRSRSGVGMGERRRPGEDAKR
jgi:hypothetical protein